MVKAEREREVATAREDPSICIAVAFCRYECGMVAPACAREHDIPKTAVCIGSIACEVSKRRTNLIPPLSFSAQRNPGRNTHSCRVQIVKATSSPL